MTETYEGGCLCGRVRFRASGRPNNVTNCHCRMCQKAAGAPVVTWAEFPAAQVAWLTGEPVWYRSSDRAERSFCPGCGASLSFRYLGGDAVDIAVAALDDPDALPPGDELWTESRCAWLPPDSRLPQFPRSRREG